MNFAAFWNNEVHKLIKKKKKESLLDLLLEQGILLGVSLGECISLAMSASPSLSSLHSTPTF
jgi:hypothetical protein